MFWEPVNLWLAMEKYVWPEPPSAAGIWHAGSLESALKLWHLMLTVVSVELNCRPPHVGEVEKWFGKHTTYLFLGGKHSL